MKTIGTLSRLVSKIRRKRGKQAPNKLEKNTAQSGKNDSSDATFSDADADKRGLWRMGRATARILRYGWSILSSMNTDLLKFVGFIILLVLVPVGYILLMFNVMDIVVSLTRSQEVVGVMPMVNSYKDMITPIVRAVVFLFFFISPAVVRDYLWRNAGKKE